MTARSLLSMMLPCLGVAAAAATLAGCSSGSSSSTPAQSGQAIERSERDEQAAVSGGNPHGSTYSVAPQHFTFRFRRRSAKGHLALVAPIARRTFCVPVIAAVEYAEAKT